MSTAIVVQLFYFEVIWVYSTMICDMSQDLKIQGTKPIIFTPLHFSSIFTSNWRPGTLGTFHVPPHCIPVSRLKLGHNKNEVNLSHGGLTAKPNLRATTSSFSLVFESVTSCTSRHQVATVAENQSSFLQNRFFMAALVPSWFHLRILGTACEVHLTSVLNRLAFELYVPALTRKPQFTTEGKRIQ